MTTLQTCTTECNPPEAAMSMSSAFGASFEAMQQPRWPDSLELEGATEMLRSLPPIARFDETDLLSAQLADVARGRAFLFQAGDCAETFADNTPPQIDDKVRVLQQMALVLTHGAGLPVVTVGRAAGQYGKPRSKDVDAAGLPSYRGDIVHSSTPTATARVPDPRRLVQAYHESAKTMNILRHSGDHDRPSLPETHARLNDFVGRSPAGGRYRAMADQMKQSIRFMEAHGFSTVDGPESPIFASHEALILDYELALLRSNPRRGGRLYATSGHFLWIGERTRQIGGAHIALADMVCNPVGLKLGASVRPDEASNYVRKLNPDNIPGRLTLITRMGCRDIRRVLPPIVEAVEKTGIEVIWQCDPMHGNTRTTETGLKTRSFDHIVDEVQGFFEVHRSMGTHPGGVHLEMTGGDVTECTGGGQSISDDALHTRYRSSCDPRLNADQALELSFLIAEMLHP